MIITRYISRGIQRFVTQSSVITVQNSNNALKGSLLTRALPSVVSSRSISQKEFAAEEAKQISWVQWLSDPLIKSFTSQKKVVTQEEITAREELLERVQACYYKKPPQEPGKELFEEAFHLLMKYDDWRSIEALWTLSENQDYTFDEALISKIENYLLEVKQRSWYED